MRQKTLTGRPVLLLVVLRFARLDAVVVLEKSINTTTACRLGDGILNTGVYNIITAIAQLLYSS